MRPSLVLGLFCHGCDTWLGPDELAPPDDSDPGWETEGGGVTSVNRALEHRAHPIPGMAPEPCGPVELAVCSSGEGEPDERPGWRQAPGAEFCDSEHTIAHETFGCLRPKGHAPPHRDYVGDPPCPNCGGLDEHSDACTTPEVTCSGGRDLTWTDDEAED